MKTICIKTRIKNGALNEVRTWFRNLRERENEVLETLRNEGVLVESAYIDKDEYFIIYHLKAEDINKAYEVFDNSLLPIDQYFKSCWKNYCEGRIVLEEIIDLETFSSKKTD